MPKDLILVRHGESEHHVRGLTGGWTDTPLTDHGRRQAERLGQALAATICGVSNSVLLSSDLLRARQLSVIIAQHTGLHPQLHTELREMNNGAAKNKTLEEAQQLALPVTMPTIDWVPYPGAESWRAMTDRIVSFLEGVMDQTQEDSILIVSHASALVAIVHWWLKLDETHWTLISYDFDRGSISHLSVNEWGERVISKLNDTSHLGKAVNLSQRCRRKLK